MSDLINHSDEHDLGVILFIEKVLIKEVQDRTLLSYEDDPYEAPREYLLPPTLATQFVDTIKVYIHKPVIVLFDADRRVHKLLLGGSNFMIFTAVWKVPNLIGPQLKKYPSVLDFKKVQLSCAMVTLIDVYEEDNTLEVSDTNYINDFENKVGRLLLPHEIRPDYRRDICRHIGTEVAVIYDQYGRILSLTIGVGIHMLLMGLWKPKARKKVTVAIRGIDEENNVLDAPYELGMKLMLPKGLPVEFKEWQPCKYYVVEHDDDDAKKVHSIIREDGEEGGRTEIYLSEFWDLRYNADEKKSVYV